MGLFSKATETGVICEAPRIEVIDDFATAEECAHIISLVRDELAPASVLNSDGASVESKLKRTSDVAWVFTDQTPVAKDLTKRVADVAGHPSRHCERIQVVHYDVGGQYTSHVDAYKDGVDNPNFQRYGQRLKTGLLYLQAPKKGGATNFPKVKAKVKAKEGRLVLFDTVIPGTTEVDWTALHGGLPVWSGEKWACNFWFSERPVAEASMKRKGGKKKSGRAKAKRRR